MQGKFSTTKLCKKKVPTANTLQLKFTDVSKYYYLQLHAFEKFPCIRLISLQGQWPFCILYGLPVPFLFAGL